MKISVVTPTIRKNGLSIVRNALQKQTFKEFEWIIGSSFDPEISEAVWILDDFRDGFWSLNRIYNQLFKHASGELIVSWQDWIWAKPEALEKFWDNYKKTNGLISGVGDQYEEVDKWGRPKIKIWADPRKNNNYGSFYECYPNDCEWNFAAIPKKAIFEVGGMDEKLDFLCRGVDQIQIVERMNDAGWKFYLDQTNESFTIRHGREDYGGEDVWNDTHGLFNGIADNRKKELKKIGQWPKVPYL